MTVVPNIPPAPVGQQGPPTRLLRLTRGGHSAARVGPSY